MESLKFCLIFVVVPLTDGAVPGTFFWKPRLGIDLAVPTTGANIQAPLTMKEIREGHVVIVDQFQFGMTVLMLAGGIADSHYYLHLNPTRAYFYTNAYRWALRHTSTLPLWLAGNKGRSYYSTHEVWKKRFHYMDHLLPKWLTSVVPYMKKDFANELKEKRRFKKYSEHAFAKHYRFPSKTFNNFKSFETKESEDEASSSSFDSSKSF